MGILKELKTTGFRPHEILALLQYKRKASYVSSIMLKELSPLWTFCYESLCKVSRSFSIVIMELEEELRHPICVFYLVLRALDTVEDDTRQPSDERAALCVKFHELLDTTGDSGEYFRTSQYGEKGEKELLENFPKVIQCYQSLAPGYRAVIKDITKRMGYGMAKHISDVSCHSVDDYNEYCHYVAGLVGYGLSDLFSASGREHENISLQKNLSNSMGLFLQKTNIVRDYLEDIIDGRTFWPEEVWSLYAKDLSNFQSPQIRESAVHCLNHLITDALEHVIDCLDYMKQIHTQNVFNFVAIPQVMAIGTLAEIYNNPGVFEGVIKIRRSLTAYLILNTKNMDDLYQVFFDFSLAILEKVPHSDPNAKKTRAVLNRIIDTCQPHVSPTSQNLIIPNVLSIVAFCGLSNYVLQRRQDHFDGAVFTWRTAGGIMEPLDMLAVGSLFIVCIYMFGFFLLPYMSAMQRAEVRRLEDERAEKADGDGRARIVNLS